MDLRTFTIIESFKMPRINLEKIDSSGLFSGHTANVKSKLIVVLEEVRKTIEDQGCRGIDMQVLAMCVLGFCLSNLDEKIKTDVRKKEAIILVSGLITRCIWRIPSQQEGDTLNSSMLSENLEILYKKGIDFVR